MSTDEQQPPSADLAANEASEDCPTVPAAATQRSRTADISSESPCVLPPHTEPTSTAQLELADSSRLFQIQFSEALNVESTTSQHGRQRAALQRDQSAVAATAVRIPTPVVELPGSALPTAMVSDDDDDEEEEDPQVIFAAALRAPRHAVPTRPAAAQREPLVQRQSIRAKRAPVRATDGSAETAAHKRTPQVKRAPKSATALSSQARPAEASPSTAASFLPQAAAQPATAAAASFAAALAESSEDHYSSDTIPDTTPVLPSPVTPGTPIAAVRASQPAPSFMHESPVRVRYGRNMPSSPHVAAPTTALQPLVSAVPFQAKRLSDLQLDIGSDSSVSLDTASAVAAVPLAPPQPSSQPQPPVTTPAVTVNSLPAFPSMRRTPSSASTGAMLLSRVAASPSVHNTSSQPPVAAARIASEDAATISSQASTTSVAFKTPKALAPPRMAMRTPKSIAVDLGSFDAGDQRDETPSRPVDLSTPMEPATSHDTKPYSHAALHGIC